MPKNLPYVGYFATTEVLLQPERFNFRSLRITPVQNDGGFSLPTGNDAMAAHFSVMIDYPTENAVEEKCLGDFENKYDAEVFRKRIARILDTADDLPMTAMCLWEVILHIRGSNNPGADVDQAIDAVYGRHGTCEMRSAMNELSEACDREYYQAVAAEQFDGSFDWEWCHNWLRTRVNWDSTGDDLPTLIETA